VRLIIKYRDSAAVNCTKRAEPIDMPFWVLTGVSPVMHVLDGSAHWRHMANTTEPSMCGLEAAFLSNYLL